MQVRRLAIIALVLAALWALVWSLRAEPIEPLEYLPRDSPVVLCERVQDPDLEVELKPSRWFSDLGVPMPPVGSFANTMQPRIFRELGFGFGTRICAAAIVPSSTQIEDQALAAADVVKAEHAFNALLDSCGCTLIKELGQIHRAPVCISKRTRRDCPDLSDRSAQIDDALAEFDAALAAQRPRLHWRVVGTLGKSGRFAVMAQTRLDWLEFPGKISTREKNATGDADDPLVQQMLGEEGVVAVIRQGHGHAILVVREIGDALIFDYFEQLADPKRWGGDWGSLDQDFLGAPTTAALALPAKGASMEAQFAELPGDVLTPRGESQGLIHLDHGRLDDLDLLMMAARRMADFRYNEPAEKSSRDALVADVLTLVWKERELHGRLRLTSEGQSWWGPAQGGETVVQHALSRATPREAYSFQAGGRHEFILRGTQLERALFDSLRGFPGVLGAIFSSDASAITGDPEDFEVKLAPGEVASGLDTTPGLQFLRTHLSLVRHKLDVHVNLELGYAEFELSE